MAANRLAVGFVVAILLVWSVAFGGGYTIALFSATAAVSGTFESAGEFAPIESDIDAALADPDVPMATERNVTTRNESIGNDGPLLEPVEGGTDLKSADGNITAPGRSGSNVTDPEPPGGNGTDAESSDETSDQPTNESDTSEDPPVESDQIGDDDSTTDTDKEGDSDPNESIDENDPADEDDTVDGTTTDDGDGTPETNDGTEPPAAETGEP